MPPVAALVIGGVASLAAPVIGISAISAISYAGLAATVVGKITKSKELMGAGKILGIAGGVASLATGAFGLASGAGETLGTAGEFVGPELPGTELGADSLSFDAGSLSTQAEFANDAAGNIGDMTADSFSTKGILAPEGANQMSGGILGSATAPTQPTPPAPSGGILESSTGVYKPPSPPGVPGLEQKPLTPTTDLNQTPPVGSTTASGMTGSVQAPGIGQSVKDWWAKLPANTKDTYLKAGMEGIGGLFNGWSEAQKLEFQRSKFEFEKQKMAEQQSNLSAQPTIARYQAPKV